jgi:DNA-binding transcriptional LysR family regulator
VDGLDQMRTFVRIVETGSLSAAARARRLSVPAVSRQLSAVEAELAVRLVLRSTRRLQITDAGRRWYEHCVGLLRALDDARADVAGSREPAGRVVISAPISFGLVHVVARLEALRRRFPRLDLEVRLEDHAVDLIGDAVDLAVRTGMLPPDRASIIAHPLLAFRRVAVASAAYLRRRGVPRHPRDLANHDGLLQHASPGWRFVHDAEVCDVSPRRYLHSGTPIALREWALAGAGIAYLPDWIAGPPLRRLFAGWTSPPYHAWALHRIELRGAPRIRAIVEALARET